MAGLEEFEKLKKAIDTTLSSHQDVSIEIENDLQLNPNNKKSTPCWVEQTITIRSKFYFDPQDKE